MRKIFLMSLMSLMAVVAFGQTETPVAMGQWRTHLAYNSVMQLTQSTNYLYAVSDGALFAVGKEDDDMQLFSKISGLSDVGIKLIKYDELNDQLLIVYSNGNLDIMTSAGVINIPDLYNKQLGTNKGINDVYFDKNKAYLSSEFGVLVLNLEKQEIAETYIIGPSASYVDVISTTIFNDKIYSLTAENEIYTADANHPNIVNYEFWSKMTNLPGAGQLQKVMIFNEHLLLLRNGKLYKQEADETWSMLLDAVSITAINKSKGKIIAQDAGNIIYVLDEDFAVSAFSTGIKYEFFDMEYDNQNDEYWAAAGDLGVASISDYNETSSNISFKKPKGPSENNIWYMTFAGEKLFVVNGGRWADKYNRVGQVMIYEDGTWTNIDGAEISAVTNYPVTDFVSVAVNPADDKHFYTTSYGRGMFEFRDEKFYKWHHGDNSMLSPIFADPYNYLRLDGMVYDAEGNLFIANTGSPAPIKILKNDGTWTEYEYTAGFVSTLGQIIISNQNPNHKWLNSVRQATRGLIIYDDGGTIDNPDDDRKIMLTSFADNDNPGSTITPTEYHCMAQDNNGTMWVGTELGPLVFYNPNRAFEPDYTCSRIKIPRNDGTGLADYLLKDETIKAIAVDGANRKWIGTQSSGLYLMSETGQETIHHFTSSNSPLLSDEVISLAINPVSGELFIGTTNGLISFQSDASQADKLFQDVYAYPNPVRENYNGIITITGLVDNTQVKITDLNGNLVYQTISNGKLATWDGKNAFGKRVNTGIYMVICANDDGTQNAITKIMVIN